MICIWSRWCHCHPIISCFIKTQNGLPFWCQLTQAVLEKKELLNECCCCCCCSCGMVLTCEMLILFPLEPATTIDLKLLNSDSDFCAKLPVLSRASFRMRLTWFSNVWRRVLPGVGSSSSLWALSITSITSICQTTTTCHYIILNTKHARNTSTSVVTRAQICNLFHDFKIKRGCGHNKTTPSYSSFCFIHT